MTRPRLSVLHCLGRSGGTLLSRCLGCMDGVLLLSEVHPRWLAAHSIAVQARAWHGLDVPDGLDFVAAVEEVRRQAAESGRVLVLRDWSHVDFVHEIEPGWTPRAESYLYEVLSSLYDVRRTCLVRDPAATWLSMTKHAGFTPHIAAGQITREGFYRGHAAFARLADRVGSTSYEALCVGPEAVVRLVCERLDIPYDPGFVGKWPAYREVTGDVESFDRTEISRRSS